VRGDAASAARATRRRSSSAAWRRRRGDALGRRPRAGVGAGAREKIFLPFYSSKPNGSGLGLAIVARIAQLHGGTVTVDGPPGGGAVFALRLPRS
jgi:light-regulated signal transduction histidine kinase (bacteriophytochrome)